jgi:hypothetical protein
MDSKSDSDSSIEEITSKVQKRQVESTFSPQKQSVNRAISIKSKSNENHKIAPENNAEENITGMYDHHMKDDNTMGRVGIKWRVRIVRVFDSEENWKGVVEVYFHWFVKSNIISQNPSSSSDYVKRRMSAVAVMTNPNNNVNMEIIDEPKLHPKFIILNDEESHCTEEIYYTCPSFPNFQFGYVSYTVTIHERLELEVFMTHILRCMSKLLS